MEKNKYQEALDGLWGAYLNLLERAPRFDSKYTEYRKTLQELIDSRATPVQITERKTGVWQLDDERPKMGVCPKCRATLHEDYNFCGICGIELDWSSK